MNLLDKIMAVVMWALTVLAALSALVNLGFFIYGGHQPMSLAVSVLNIFSVVTGILVIRLSDRLANARRDS